MAKTNETTCPIERFEWRDCGSEYFRPRSRTDAEPDGSATSSRLHDGRGEFVLQPPGSLDNRNRLALAAIQYGYPQVAIHDLRLVLLDYVELYGRDTQ